MKVNHHSERKPVPLKELKEQWRDERKVQMLQTISEFRVQDSAEVWEPVLGGHFSAGLLMS